MQLIARILLKELLNSWGSWDKYKDYYISELFPALFRDPEKGSKEEKELLLQIKENVSKDEWENLENYLGEILNSNCSINDIINEVKQLISDGDFDEANDLYDQIKNLSINILLPYEYENIKNNFCQNTKNQINYLLERYKFEEAGELYSKYSKVLNYSDFNHVEDGYLKRQERDVFINKLDYLLQSGKFSESDILFSKDKNPLSVSEYEEIKSEHIKKFLEESFLKAEKLSDEQLLAVSDTSQNLLLRARAGSGKTTTLSAKIAYLIKGEKVDPDKIIALCFNASAARNIIKTLEDKFDIKYHEKENIATFHSLAGQISPLDQGIETLFDDRDPLGKQKLTRFIELILAEKWDRPFYDLEKDEISSQDSIFGFIKKIWVKLKYAKFKIVVYAIAREDKRLDTDEEANELENENIEFGSKEHYLFRRNLTYITLDGKHVKSFGEKCIADYLFEHNINYNYEPNFRMDGHTYYPDFELYDHHIILEHWGVDESDKEKKVPKNWSKTWDEYVKEMRDKRKYWNEKKDKNGMKYRLLQTNITQLKDGRESFENKLTAKLKECNIVNDRLSIDEIIMKMSHNLRSKFAGKIVKYIQKAKQNRCSPEEMKLKISEAKYPKYNKVNVFLNLANEIYKQYEIDTRKKKKIDFYDYLFNAEREINTNKWNCKLRSGVSIGEIEWLLIDEFQDFSPLFLAFPPVIKKYNPNVKLFCVGDDWQAINAFIGSDVELFNKFEEEFPVNYAIKNLTINRRSKRNIVDFGNKIMVGHGIESGVNSDNQDGGVIECGDVNQGWIESDELRDAFGIDIGAKFDIVVLRYLNHAVKIIDKYLKNLEDDNEFTLLILSRRREIRQHYKLEDFTKKIEVFFTKKYSENKNKIEAIFNKQIDEKGNEYRQIEPKTVHQSKGLQANVVIVLEATNRCFPLIHPDFLLFEIFGDKLDKIEDEERRLFYVACTRAKSDLYLLYEEDFDRKKSLTEFYPR